MNRQERRKLKKQGVQVPKDPSINIKLSDLSRDIMTPTQHSAMIHEINRQCLEADARFSLDLDTMVLWTLYQCYGWREKRLHDFYLTMAREHRRMREYYQMDDLYGRKYITGDQCHYWAELVRPVRQKAFNWRKSDGNRAAALREAKAAQELAKMGQMALQIAEALRPQ